MPAPRSQSTSGAVMQLRGGGGSCAHSGPWVVAGWKAGLKREVRQQGRAVGDWPYLLEPLEGWSAHLLSSELGDVLSSEVRQSSPDWMRTASWDGFLAPSPV